MRIFQDIGTSEILIKIAISLGFLALFVAIAAAVKPALPKLATLVFRRKDPDSVNAISRGFAGPLRYLLIILGLYCFIRILPLNEDISVKLLAITSKLMRVCLILIVSIAAQNLVGAAPSIFKSARREDGSRTVLDFIVKVVKAVIILITVVIIIGEFGYDVNGLIAGLGLSGLTFALAAQDTASNFVSGLAILLDKPFIVGDWISAAGIEGIVEEINFRSCRIRTFDDALITVPNNKISSDSITNWTRMNTRRTIITINLLYSTSSRVLKDICIQIKERLSELDDIVPDNLLVRFDAFSSSSLDVTVTYFTPLTAIRDYVLLREKVQYILKDIVEKSDTDFAYNSITVYKG